MREKQGDPAGDGTGVWRSEAFRRWLIRSWLVALPLLTLAVVYRQREEVGQVWTSLRTADPRWLIVGMAIEATTLLTIAFTYRLLLRRLGHDLPYRMLASAHLQRVAIGTISPLSGPTSVYVFLRLLARWRVPAQDALLTIAIRSGAGQIAFVATIIAGLVLFQPSGGPTLSGALALTAGLAGALLGILLLVRFVSARWSGREPAWPRCLPPRVRGWLTEFVARFRRHHLTARDLLWPALLAIATRAGAVALLFASLRAAGAEASVGTAVAVYFAALVAHAMMPVFGGTGAVEVVTATALTQTGVPGDLAVAVILIWRAIDFWLPLGIGLAAHGAVLAAHPRAPQPAPRARRTRLAPQLSNVGAWAGWIGSRPAASRALFWR